MTKEEYEKLLQSDYWKGYSYSLIKERNFTCEDCGRQFYNQRNKLHVHHLFYRDVNPWSYNPDELVVLCEDCHKKRHGFIPDEKGNSIEENIDRYEWLDEERPKPYRKYFLAGILCFFIISAFFYLYMKSYTKGNDASNLRNEPSYYYDYSHSSSQPSSSPKKDNIHKEFPAKTSSLTSIDKSVIYESEDYPVDENEEIIKSSDDGLSTLERKQHARVVKQAQDAGVSTEGSTLDILDRIQHARVVKQAQDAGVSTEGSTLDILDRIQHARVVKQAQDASVSTEGSTLDILDRITRKRLEGY